MYPPSSGTFSTLSGVGDLSPVQKSKTEHWRVQISFTKKEHEPKLLSPDIFRWGRGLPREGVGAKKFDMSLETRETKHFWRDIPGFCRDIPEAPEKFEKTNLCSIFGPYKYQNIFLEGALSGTFSFPIRLAPPIYPKESDPAVLKIVRRSKFTMRSKFATV